MSEKFREEQLKTFKEKVLPEWAASMERYKLDVSLFPPDQKKEFMRLFREYWDSNPPF